MIQKIQATQVLKKTLELEKDKKIICHEGGSRSSKTWSIFQYYILKALQGEKFTLTIARANLTWVKATLLKDLQEIVEKYNLPISPEINTKRPDQIYQVMGGEFAFFGLDYPEKLHGRKQTYAWLNEVMEIGKKQFDQIEMRTEKGMVLDYNPTDDMHWVFDLQKRGDVGVIKSTMLDNPFLPQSIIDKIKGYEPTPENIASGTADLYMWEVYGKGNKARLQGAIFENWDIVEDVPEQARFVGLGLDFGYTNDPTAIVEMYMMDDEIYWNQLEYKKGLTNQNIIARLKELQISPETLVVADSAEPKSIEEIRLGNFNIKGVAKGQDSINFGIDLLKQKRMHITKRSIDLENELRKYKWMEDKNGVLINRPIDSWNHLIDACRYIAMEVLGGNRVAVVGSLGRLLG